MTEFDTISKRPLPKRPATGLLAWKATIGYISSQYSPDAMLKIQAYPISSGGVSWGATVSWAQNLENIWDKSSMGEVLRDLWLKVDLTHSIFQNDVEATKCPVNYSDEDWVDVPTQEILQRLIWTTQTAFPDDWTLILIYQPVDNPNMRAQGRLLARSNSVHVSGRGASVLDACHDLYRNAARAYASANKPEE